MEAIRLSLIRMQALLAKEFRELLRDVRLRFFVVAPPLVQLVVFGYAATFDIHGASIGIVDHAKTQQTRTLLSAVAAVGEFRPYYYADMDAASAALNRNAIRAIVQIPADYDRHPAIQLIADGSDSNSAQLVVGQLSRFIGQQTRDPRNRPPIEVQERAWFNPNLGDRDFFIPGIIANVVLIATMTLTAMAVVREREMGTLERLMVTPIARMEFLLGKMIPVACVGLFDVMLVTVVGVAWFDVPLRGSIAALAVGTVLFLGSSLGLGLLISSYSSTQQQAVLLGFFVIMPAVMFSGFAFPIENMPLAMQYITYVDPLRYYLEIIRDVFLRGGRLGDHVSQYLAMLLLGLAALGLSIRRVR